VNPTAFGRAARVRRLTRALTNRIAVEVGWQVEVAAMLSQVGCVSIPQDVLRRTFQGLAITTAERQMVRRHPRVGHDLIANVPRLEPVAEMILYQAKRYDGGGFPRDAVKGAQIPVGARLLKIALDYDVLTASAGNSSAVAVQSMRKRKGWYDPVLLDALQAEVAEEAPTGVRGIRLSELRSEMVLAEDLLSASGVVLVPRGQEITTSLLMRLENFALGVGIKEPIKIVVELEEESRLAARRRSVPSPIRRAG